jgi:predicted amidohydrolase
MRSRKSPAAAPGFFVVASLRLPIAGLWLISSDVTGERDGRIAWGPTAVLNPEGQVVAQLPLEEPGLLVFDFPCIEPVSYRD